jgi:PAS domain S-box-containing protein
VFAAAGVVAIAYLLAARLGLALLSAHSDVAVFWPASGLAAGILITFGPRARPALIIGVVVGTVAAGLMSDRSLLTSIFNGSWNAGEALLVAWLLERWFGQSFTFGDLRRVVGFLVAACLATAASGIGGAATMTLLHPETTAPYWDVWREWFLSSWVGLVVVAPLVIGMARTWRNPPSQGEWIEGVGALSLTVVACSYTMAQKSDSWLSFSQGAFVLPLLLWLTARCQPTFAIAGAFLVSVAIICATTFGIGRFGDAAVPIMQRVTGAQLAMMTITLFTLVLAVLFAQRKKAEEALRQSEGQLAKERTMLARLHEVGSRLWLKRDLRQALDEILAGAIELLNADMGTIRILDTTRGKLKIEAQRGFTQEFLDYFGEISADGDSPCCRALRSAERIVIEDIEVDERFTPYRAIARAAGYRAVQSTPIMSREGVLLGTLATHFRTGQEPSDQDLRLLDLYVRQAADIIEHHKAVDALRTSEGRLRLAQLKTGIGLWDWDLRTGEVTWTPELAAIFGVEPGTVKSYADFRDRVHPDDIERVEADRDAAIRRRDQLNLEFRIIRSDGEVRWILAMGGALYDEATGKPTRVLGNNLDITERKLAEERQRVLVAELDHRVKNALATVSSVVSQTAVRNGSVGNFVAALDGRIRSMATTHELLSTSRWRGVSLKEIIQRELAPYATPNNVEINGPEIVLRAEAGQAMAMVLHELTTNAAKYGALSTGNGRVSIRWDEQPNGHSRSCLVFEWQEIGGPLVEAPGNPSYGTTTIRDLIPYEFGGTVDLVLALDGVRCRLELPADWLSSESKPVSEANAQISLPTGAADT